MARAEPLSKEKKKESLGEIVRTVVYAVLIAVVIRTVAYEPFNIPSGSMLSTLLIGDYVFVSKFAYGYSRHSMPFSPPVFSGRILAAEPERGDVIVFKLPTDNATDYIKRLIGLPGDEIQMIRGILHINGVAVKRERVDDFVNTDNLGYAPTVPRYRETLPNGVSYLTLDLQNNDAGENTDVYTVPPGHYFMMGDNRNDSTDSRYTFHVGYVPRENLVGRAEIIFFSTNGLARFWEVWKWPFTVRYGRLLNAID